MYRQMLLASIALTASCAGCGADSAANLGNKPSDAAAKYRLSDEPTAAKSVIDARGSAKDGDEVTLVGRIGGSASPFVAGRAMFTIVDTSFVPCNEREGDTCEQPWDYCCDTDQLPSGTATIKIVDDKGDTVSLDGKKDLALAELATVVVKGKAKRDTAGNLTVLAPGVFVRK
jgi:hypothetical protein